MNPMSPYLQAPYTTLAGYLNAQFTMAMTLELLARFVVAGLCGVCIGIERMKRLKEVGMRTHVVVCCTAALMMVVSKYGFADLTSLTGTAFNGTRGADPARIAAQVVSGVGFLGAGTIFKGGSSIKGLTTAAGVWATAGIGLAIGSGMYILGIASTAILILIQTILHRYSLGAPVLTTHQLNFSIQADKDFQREFYDYLEARNVQAIASEVTYTEDGIVTYQLLLKMPHGTIQDLDDFLHAHGQVRTVSYSNITE